MSANISDKFNKASNMGGNYPPVATVTSARATSGSTLSCDDLSGWATDTPVHFSTFKVNADGTIDTSTQTDWKGIVIGDTITEMTRLAGAADSGNASGDKVELNPTVGWLDDLITGILVSHKQDGTLKDSIVGTSAISDSAVTSAKLASNAVTTVKINDAAVTSAKIDWTTMKDWVPDYANIGNTNIDNIPVTQNGFVYAYVSAYSNDHACAVYIQINGKRLAWDYAEAQAPSGARVATVSGVFPVSVGDVVTTDLDNNHGRDARVLFIPGKWV